MRMQQYLWEQMQVWKEPKLLCLQFCEESWQELVFFLCDINAGDSHYKFYELIFLFQSGEKQCADFWLFFPPKQN